ncbi:MAG: hypothetical protein ACK5U7_12685 [Bacteroidota bacterium]
MMSKITAKITWTKFALMTGKEQKLRVESSTTLKSLALGGNKTNEGKQRTLQSPEPSKVAHWFGSRVNLAATQSRSLITTTMTSRWM